EKESIPIPLPILLRGLHRIFDSVRFWNKERGRRGYLEFVWDTVGVDHSEQAGPVRIVTMDEK
ncbi:MAG: hypothetical protein ACETWB_05910, partial [Anaerolineae bacterium]